MSFFVLPRERVAESLKACLFATVISWLILLSLLVAMRALHKVQRKKDAYGDAVFRKLRGLLSLE